MSDPTPSLDALITENERLAAENRALLAENARLERRLGELERRLTKSSATSSLPPSSDGPAQRAEQSKTRAERRAEEKRERRAEVRRRGKQPGAPGSHLEMRDDPDEVIVSDPSECASCHSDLADAEVVGTVVRQVLDVPEPQISCTEYQARKKRCRCGAETTGGFPPAARGPVSYGPTLRAMALYLSHAQHVPVERTAKAMAALFSAPVSTGFVSALVAEAAGSLDPFIDAVKVALTAAPVLHVDETSHQVGTKTWWLHTAATSEHTLLVASETRGKVAPDTAGVLPDFGGVMVHDRLAMYFSYDCEHAVCGAHLQRDLAAVAEIDGHGWANAMAIVLTQMNNAAHAARSAGATAIDTGVLAGLLTRYDELVAMAMGATYAHPGHRRDGLEREAYNLAVALRDRRTEITRFAVDLSVPMTNNEAERSFRMAKVHRKISGCFQAADHAAHFATIRSYLDTARKHGLGALDVLTALFRGDPWIPPALN